MRARAIRTAAFALIAFVMSAVPAAAALSRAQLNAVSATPSPDARLDPNMVARDATGKMRNVGAILDGRPGFVAFIDYTCNTLCGTDLELLSAAIQNAHLPPSAFRIVVFGIDPKDTARSALAMEHKEMPPALWPMTALLLPGEKAVQSATRELGFHYVYDRAADQFAHPAVVYVVGSDGSFRNMLSPFALGVSDMHTVLTTPAPASGILERVHLFCYAYDPATGIYSLRIAALLKAGGIATVLALAGSVTWMILWGRRST